jgi:hypothetical protein
MQKLGTSATGSLSEIVLLYEGNAQSPACRVDGHTTTGSAPADNQEIEEGFLFELVKKLLTRNGQNSLLANDNYLLSLNCL